MGDDITFDVEDVGYEDMRWIFPDQVRYRWRAAVNVVMNLRVLQIKGIS
jgi:hypothetical protein